VVLAVSALAVALNSWASFGLKLTRQLKPLVFSNVVFAAVSIGLALVWAPRGLVWIGWAWGAGNLASGLAALIPLLARRRRRSAQAAKPPQQSRPQTLGTRT
jgi:O-antigen/teichoic acid export membrane protein